MGPISPIAGDNPGRASLQSPFMLFRSPQSESPAGLMAPPSGSSSLLRLDSSQYNASPGLTGFGHSPGHGHSPLAVSGESPFAQFAAQLPILGTPGLSDALLPSPAASAPPWAIQTDLSPRTSQLRPQRLFNPDGDDGENQRNEIANPFAEGIFNPFDDEEQEEPDDKEDQGTRKVIKPKGVRQPNGTSGVIKPCSCKKSRCLKKYCECFASNRYCDGCFCVGCQNVANPGPVEPDPPLRPMPVNSATHGDDMFVMNPIENSEDFKDETRANPVGKGCHCKKSQCAKKYCECFQMGALCSAKCECRDCKNKTWDIHRSRSPGGMRPNPGRRPVKQANRGIKRPPAEMPTVTPGSAGAVMHMGDPSSPSRLKLSDSLSPSENPANQSDLDITFTAMTEGLDDAMMEQSGEQMVNYQNTTFVL